MNPNSRAYIPVKRHKGRLSLTILFIWIVVLSAVSYNRQGISDYLSLRDYSAPSDVAALADADTLTPSARKVFYVNRPQIIDKTPFTSSCPTGTERSVVLGCYHGNQAGIFVLKVTDSRLQGIEQVTAAHELLHAAYDRLSTREKQSIDAQLNDYYQHQLTDATIKAQIEDYKRTEPNDVVNEMHSLFGTQITQLPAGLEQYYAKYFTNRAAIAKFYTQYQAEFTSRQDQIKAYDERLQTLKTQIEAAQKSLSQLNDVLDAKRRSLDASRSRNDIAAYNAAVPDYNASVDSYNSQAQALRQSIADYNSQVEARNAIAAETAQLISDISANVPDANN